MRGTRGVALLLLLLATACSPVVRNHDQAPAMHLVIRGDELAAQGQGSAAVVLYDRVLYEYPGNPAGAAALYGLARLQVDPRGRVRNYRAAYATFGRLLSEYPQSRWDSEARAWRAVLWDLLARESEAAQLKAQIERLRRTDLELERPR